MQQRAGAFRIGDEYDRSYPQKMHDSRRYSNPLWCHITPYYRADVRQEKSVLLNTLIEMEATAAYRLPTSGPIEKTPLPKR